MKKLSVIATTLLVASSGAFAQANTTDSFNVTVSLTSACSVKKAAGSLPFGTYVAFQAAAATASASTIFECTRGLGATFSFDNPGGLATGSAANASSISGAGVVAGLLYTMSGSASKTQTGTAATSTSAGTPDQYTVAISGSIAGGQAGDASVASTQVRTLTITY